MSVHYSDQLVHPLVESTLGDVDFAFYSYHKGKGDFIRSFLQDKVNRGVAVATATFGEEGSLSWDGTRFYDGPVYPTKHLVNTVGAGDSFIAGVRGGVVDGEDVGGCLDRGARIASEVVSVFEPWVVSE